MFNIAAIYRLIPIKIFINKIFCAQMFQNFLNFPSVLNLWLRSLFILKDFLILLTFLNFIININIKEPFVNHFNLTCIFKGGFFENLRPDFAAIVANKSDIYGFGNVKLDFNGVFWVVYHAVLNHSAMLCFDLRFFDKNVRPYHYK